MRQRNEESHSGTATLAGWSDAAYGDQSTSGKRRLGYVIALISSTLRGQCRIIQWASKFTRKLAEGSLGGEVYAFSEMSDHMSMLREFDKHFLDMSPGKVGFEDCESLFTQLANKKTIAEEFLV